MHAWTRRQLRAWADHHPGAKGGKAWAGLDPRVYSPTKLNQQGHRVWRPSFVYNSV